MQTISTTEIAGIALDASHDIATITERIRENEQRLRAAAAETYVHAFQFLLAYARQDRKTLSAHQLTAHFLTQTDKGKLLRKAAPGYAQLKCTTDKKAEKLLLNAVNLVQHAPQLLRRLWSGDIPTEQVRITAEKLASFTSPRPTRGPDGTPLTDETYAEEVQRHENAKNRLGTKLEQLANPTLPEKEFASEANRLREEHHPDDQAARHRAAIRRRCVRITTAQDGMANLFAHIPSDSAAAIESILQDGTSTVDDATTPRTKTQRRADLLIELLTRQRALGPVEPSQRQPSDAPAAEENPALPGLEPVKSPPASSDGDRLASSHRRFFAYVLFPFDTWVRLGGTVAHDQFGFLRDTYPELLRQAMVNRNQKGEPSDLEPTGTSPQGAAEASHVSIIGSNHRLSDGAAAALLPEIAMMQAVLTHPATGYPIGLSVRTRRPAPTTKDLLILRDQTCRYPGCDVPGTECEIDHVTNFALGGTSDLHSLALLCKKHHGGKSAGWWQVRLRPDLGDGVLEFHFPHTNQTQITRPRLPLDPTAWQHIRTQLEQPPF